MTVKTVWASSKKDHRTYYVNTAGNDANPGTKNKPFRSVGKINRLHLIAGDTVYFKSGQTFEGSLALGAGISGKRGRPIVITSYGWDNAMIDSKDSAAIRIYKNSYIKFRQLSLRGNGRKTGNVKDGYIFMADRWNKLDLERSTYLWLPLTVTNGKVKIKGN